MTQRTSHGFTLIELITVMVILGIIGIAAMPRFFDRETFEARGFYEQATSMLRYAQKVAIAQRRAVSVTATANQVCLTYTAGGAAVLNPADGQAFCRPAPAGITLSPTSFSFSPLGQPSSGAVTIGVTGDGITRNITVEPETGYVH